MNNGISSEEKSLDIRQKIFGENQLKPKKPPNFLQIFKTKLKDISIIIVFIVSLISFVAGFVIVKWNDEKPMETLDPKTFVSLFEPILVVGMLTLILFVSCCAEWRSWQLIDNIVNDCFAQSRVIIDYIHYIYFFCITIVIKKINI